ncbi:MAG: sensor histidine kinase [Ginsengibacter sp.]
MDTNESKIYIALLTGVVVHIVVLAFFVITIIRYQRRKIDFEEKRLLAQFNYLDSVRERIGIDLHDDLGPSLSLLKMKLGQLKTADNEARKIIDFCKSHFDDVIVRLKRISFSMIPRTLQRQGLNDALKELVNIMSDSTGIKVKYRYDAGVVNEQMGTHIYRMAQEILNNIVKHSKASFVYFTVTRNKNIIELHIKDNGTGFNKKEAVEKRRGLGLENITSRADLLRGTIYLTTQPGKGVDYLIQIPWHA